MTQPNNHTFPPEIQEVAHFLSDIKPFDGLDVPLLTQAARQITTTYHRAQSAEQILDYEKPSLFIVRAGTFDVRNQQGELVDRVTSGGFFGFLSLLTGESRGHTLHVIEDGLLYRLDQRAFKALRQHSAEFDQFFVHAFEQRLRVGLRSRSENTAWATPISDVMANTLISVTESTSILQAAQAMTKHNIASIAIIDDHGDLSGIFTDKDCRSRVIANQVSWQLPITEVMTRQPVTIDQNEQVHQATLLMIRHKIKHLPVTNKGKAVSMVTLSDLIRLQRSDPVLMIGEIHRASSVEELVTISNQIPELLLQLINLDVRADDLGRVLTSVTGALTRQLITLAQQQLGPEPVPFVWLAFGSQGRQDQSAKSDQDNGLLLHDNANQSHDNYFRQLAEFVNHGLDACGYVYCPGDIMAQNQQWRMPLRGWLAVFRQWITQPSAKALMHASIFFDMRPIYTSAGAEGIYQNLHGPILALAQKNSIFLSLLTQNSLELTPPIGFFKQLVVEHNGEHKDTLDIKKRGMMPVTDVARILSLAHGLPAINTRERLHSLIEHNAINQRDGKNLLDAHEFIAHQRLLHQGEQLKQSAPPDNHLRPADLTALTSRQLKDAFKVVRDAQQGLKQRFGGGMI